jgi:hypothetical protein
MGSVFTIQSGAAGTLQQGDTATIAIAATAVPGSSTAGTPLTGVLALTTNVPGSTSVSVPVQMVPKGGSLKVTPSVASFGQVQLGTAATPLPVTITNTGNAPVQLALGTSTNSDFSVTYTGAPAAATIAAAGTLPGAQAEFTASSTTMESATIPLQTTGVLCGTSPAAISLSGQGTTAPVTVGPAQLDFGTVPCGSTGAVNTVTITNGYTFAITYSAVLAAGTGSAFSLDIPAGSVAAKSKAQVQVTPKPIPVPGSVSANAYGDTLTVTTSAPMMSPVSIPLFESASGAVLSIVMPKTAFGPVNANSSGSLPFTVANAGTVDAPLTLQVTGAGFAASFTGSATATAGGSAAASATFAPASTSTTLASGSLSVTTSAAVCQAASPVSLTAQPEVPIASFPTATVPLASTCPNGGTGANTTGTATVTITNGGDTPLLVSGVTTSSPDVAAQGPAAGIPAGMSGVISLQTTVPANTPSATYPVTLSFTTNELGSPTHKVPLSVVVHGANLSFVDGNRVALPNSTLTFNSPGCTAGALIQYGVSNTGDTAITVTGPTNYSATAPSGSQAAQNYYTSRLCGADTTTCFANHTNGTFEQATPATVSSMGVTFDTIGEYDEYFNGTTIDAPCNDLPGSPIGPDLFTYAESGPVCVPLPQLTYLFNYGAFTSCSCS